MKRLCINYQHLVTSVAKICQPREWSHAYVTQRTRESSRGVLASKTRNSIYNSVGMRFEVRLFAKREKKETPTVDFKGEEWARETLPLARSCGDIAKGTPEISMPRIMAGSDSSAMLESGHGDWIRFVKMRPLQGSRHEDTRECWGLPRNHRLLCCIVKLIVNVCVPFHSAMISSPVVSFEKTQPSVKTLQNLGCVGNSPCLKISYASRAIEVNIA